MVAIFADISHHQLFVNLATYKAAGLPAVAIKCTGGALDGTLQYVDPMFGQRWREADAAGLARVAYHFARNNNHGADELDWFLSQISAAGGLNPTTDVLCYDQEDNRTAATYALAQQRTSEFTAAAVAAGYGDGWIYSGKWYLEPAGITARDVPPGWRNLWLSDYGNHPDDAVPVPAGWQRSHLVARQYTDRETIPGVLGDCDASRLLHEYGPLTLRGLSMADIDAITAQLDGLNTKLDKVYNQVTYGDAPDATNPDGTPADRQTHPNNLERIRNDLAALRRTIEQQQPPPKDEPQLTVQAVREAVAAGVRDALGDHVTVTVTVTGGEPSTPPPA